ncbi:MAG TPA: RyR domain-containing protein [Acidobacteriaceae bacterium]|jgi:hypothetical protein|nr:RyR domain-containing protein [Acidobacteriaceae bacterium]
MQAGNHIRIGFIRPGQPGIVNVTDGLIVSVAQARDGEPVLAIAFHNPERPGIGALDQIDFRHSVKHLSHEDVQQGRESATWDYPVDPMSNLEDLALSAATVAHEANRILCAALGDFSQSTADKAEWWQIHSASQGVKAIAAQPDLSPADSHAGWMKQKFEEGWVYGPVKDVEKKEHPCMVPYDELPVEQRLKDYLFGIVVRGVLRLQQPLLPVANPGGAQNATLIIGKPGDASVSRQQVIEYVRQKIAAGGPAPELPGANMADYIDALNVVALEVAAQLAQTDSDPRAVADYGQLSAEERNLLAVEMKHYSHGTSATGTAPLPDLSPEEQEAQAQKRDESAHLGVLENDAPDASHTITIHETGETRLDDGQVVQTFVGKDGTLEAQKPDESAHLGAVEDDRPADTVQLADFSPEPSTTSTDSVSREENAPEAAPVAQ